MPHTLSPPAPKAVGRLAAPSPEEAGDGMAGNFSRSSDSLTCLSGENTGFFPKATVGAWEGSYQLIHSCQRKVELVKQSWAGRLVHIPGGGAWKKPPSSKDARSL